MESRIAQSFFSFGELESRTVRQTCYQRKRIEVHMRPRTARTSDGFPVWS